MLTDPVGSPASTQSPPMTAKTLPSNPPSASLTPAGLPAQLRRSLEAPLAALIASLEGLERDFPAEDSRGARFGHAIELIESLRQNVQALVDLAAPDEAAPLTCSLEELARNALRQAPSRVRPGVVLALEQGELSLRIDGPLVSRGLSYLIQAHIAPGTCALLRAGRVGDAAQFTLVCPPRDAEHARVGLREATPIATGEALLSMAAERELTRLGGSVHSTLATNGALKVSVRLPLEKRVGGGL